MAVVRFRWPVVVEARVVYRPYQRNIYMRATVQSYGHGRDAVGQREPPLKGRKDEAKAPTKLQLLTNDVERVGRVATPLIVTMRT